MTTDPQTELNSLRRAIAGKREQCRQAYADNRLGDFHRLTGEVESLGLLMLRVAEQTEPI
jgi:hypothetical protein